MDGAGTWPIEFTEENSLPSAKYKVFVFTGNSQRATGQGGHNVGRRVPFSMLVGKVRNHFSECCEYIPLNIRISAFINCQTRGGVRIENIEQAIVLLRGDNAFELPGDVDEFILR